MVGVDWARFGGDFGGFGGHLRGFGMARGILGLRDRLVFRVMSL